MSFQKSRLNAKVASKKNQQESSVAIPDSLSNQDPYDGVDLLFAIPSVDMFGAMVSATLKLHELAVLKGADLHMLITIERASPKFGRITFSSPPQSSFYYEMEYPVSVSHFSLKSNAIALRQGEDASRLIDFRLVLPVEQFAKSVKVFCALPSRSPTIWMAVIGDSLHFVGQNINSTPRADPRQASGGDKPEEGETRRGRSRAYVGAHVEGNQFGRINNTIRLIQPDGDCAFQTPVYPHMDTLRTVDGDAIIYRLCKTALVPALGLIRASDMASSSTHIRFCQHISHTSIQFNVATTNSTTTYHDTEDATERHPSVLSEVSFVVHTSRLAKMVDVMSAIAFSKTFNIQVLRVGQDTQLLTLAFRSPLDASDSSGGGGGVFTSLCVWCSEVFDADDDAVAGQNIGLQANGDSEIVDRLLDVIYANEAPPGGYVEMDWDVDSNPDVEMRALQP